MRRLKISGKDILITGRNALIAICFVLAYNMERPEKSRGAMLVLIFALLLASTNFKEIKYIKYSRFYSYTFLLDTMIVFFLEYNSKYLVNFYIHSIYFVLLVSAGILLSKNNGTLIGAVIFLISGSKFVRLIYNNPSPVNISQVLFNFFIFISGILLIRYSKYLSEEKERIRLLYSELKSYSERVRELTISEERNRIAIEIHDTIGHHMTGLITELEMCKRLINKDDQRVEELLADAAKTARMGLVDIRRAVDALKMDNLSFNNILEIINDIMLKSTLKIEISAVPENPGFTPSEITVIYRNIQEALTNVIKHSSASRVQIKIERNDESTKVSISDNGIDIGVFNEGNGLSGIRSRIAAAGGDTRIYFDKGFNIEFSIPLQ